jgi:tetratricopeptide (TPR) repeat protein
LRAAFAHFQAEDRPANVMRLEVSLQRFTISRGHNDVIDYLQPAVDLPDVAPSALAASAMLAMSQMIGLFLRRDAAELAAARQYAGRGLAIAETTGDQALIARLHAQLAEAAYYAHDLETVRQEAEQGIEIARRVGDVQLLGEHLSCLALAATDDGDARRIRLEALDCDRQSGDDLLAANELQHLYGLDLTAGQLADANDHLEQAVALAEQPGADLFLYFLRSDLGILRLIQERYADAAPLIRRCLQVARRTGLQIDASQLVLGAACCAAWRGDYDRAARLHGVADADLRRSIELGTIKWSAVEQELRDREQRKLRGLMGDGPFDEAHREGCALTPAQAVELALSPEASGSGVVGKLVATTPG